MGYEFVLHAWGCICTFFQSKTHDKMFSSLYCSSGVGMELAGVDDRKMEEKSSVEEGTGVGRRVSEELIFRVGIFP